MFSVLNNGKPVTCAISREALEDHYGAHPGEKTAKRLSGIAPRLNASPQDRSGEDVSRRTVRSSFGRLTIRVSGSDELRRAASQLKIETVLSKCPPFCND